MNKKFAVMLLAAALVFSVAGQAAAAYFDDLTLIRSIYTTTGTVEVGTDLGINAGTLSMGSPQAFGPAVGLGTFDGGLNSLVVGYWAHDMANRDFYATGFANDTDGLTMLGRKQQTADATYNATQTKYAASGLAQTIMNPKTTLGSYFNSFDKNGGANTGSMNANLDSSSYEMTLSLALMANGYVDQILYKFDYDGTGSAKAGIEVATIRTFLTSDGHTIDLAGTQLASVINPSAVPIPGTVLLLGSGLLGLFGVRRKKA